MQMKGEKMTDYAVIKQLPQTQEPLHTQCWWLPYCGHDLTYIFSFTVQYRIAISQILLIQGVNEYWMLHIREYFPIKSVNFYSITENISIILTNNPSHSQKSTKYAGSKMFKSLPWRHTSLTNLKTQFLINFW